MLEGFTQNWGIKFIVLERRIWWSLGVKAKGSFSCGSDGVTLSCYPSAVWDIPLTEVPPSGRLSALIAGVKCVRPLILSCARRADRYTPLTPVFLSHLSLSFFYQPLPFPPRTRGFSSYPLYRRPGPKMPPIGILPVVAPISFQFSAVCTQPGILAWFCPRHPLTKLLSGHPKLSSTFCLWEEKYLNFF